ncbi:MAG: Mu transposase C-terminal domain-containing protein [Legionella sp.]|uniref:Mu transposase C-terminal domain-containing protein n=1 Tax=Legionella sp. TaxID=459 RepID=UPI0039E2B276
MPRDPRTFLIDFLPVVRRSLQRDGITIDHITYYSNSLRPWIQLRNQPGRLLIRRDPRDLSRIFVLDAESNCYLEVPYRTLSRPTITLWEHKLARKRLREQRRAAVDEARLFSAIDELREIERKSEALTRTARRNRARRKNDSMKTEHASIPAKRPAEIASIGSVRPFEDIEPW